MEFKGNKKIEELSDLLKDESTRCAVIVSAAYFDEKLAELLGSAKGSFADRIKDALDWGLLTQHEHDDLQVLRQFRNAFAHDLRVKDFDTNSSAKVAALNLWTTAKEAFGLEQHIKTPKDMLLWVVGVIAIRLGHRMKQKIGPLPEPPLTDINEWPPTIAS